MMETPDEAQDGIPINQKFRTNFNDLQHSSNDFDVLDIELCVLELSTERVLYQH